MLAIEVWFPNPLLLHCRTTCPTLIPSLQWTLTKECFVSRFIEWARDRNRYLDFDVPPLPTKADLRARRRQERRRQPKPEPIVVSGGPVAGYDNSPVDYAFYDEDEDWI